MYYRQIKYDGKISTTYPVYSVWTIYLYIICTWNFITIYLPKKILKSSMITYNDHYDILYNIFLPTFSKSTYDQKPVFLSSLIGSQRRVYALHTMWHVQCFTTRLRQLTVMYIGTFFKLIWCKSIFETILELFFS